MKTLLSYRQNANCETLKYARQMRRRPTRAEKILWNELKFDKMGCRIRRQAIILGFIADFYCARHRLIIECDGSNHNKIRDSMRDKIMENKGFRVMRFSNKQIVMNLPFVLDEIRRQLGEG